jgi:hypothetical protein
MNCGCRSVGADEIAWGGSMVVVLRLALAADGCEAAADCRGVVFAGVLETFFEFDRAFAACFVEPASDGLVVTGCNSHDQKPWRWGAVVAFCCADAVPHRGPQAITKAATKLARRVQPATCAAPPCGCDSLRVGLLEQVVMRLSDRLSLPAGKSVWVAAIMPSAGHEPIAQTLPAVTIDRSGQKDFLIRLVQSSGVNDASSVKF